MKQLLCLLAVILTIAVVNAKHEYKIRLVQVAQARSVFELDDEYGDQALTQFNISAVDVSANGLFGTLVVTKDFPEDTLIYILVQREGQERMEEYYKRDYVNYCEYVKENPAIMHNVFRVANFTDCPPKAGTYSITGMTVDETTFTEDLPVPSAFHVEVKISPRKDGPAAFTLLMIYEVVPAGGK